MIFLLAELPLAIFAVSLGAVGGWASAFLLAWLVDVPNARAKLWSGVRTVAFGGVAFCPFLAALTMSQLPSDGRLMSSALGLFYSYAMGVLFVLFLWMTGRFIRQEVGQFGMLTHQHNRTARMSGFIGASSMILTVAVGLIR